MKTRKLISIAHQIKNLQKLRGGAQEIGDIDRTQPNKIG